ncbi:hypothetical protein HNR44_002159 [Geomicrobium halophilum]|uniref:Uncharacterized protein n=1 Tax=Geomicrobium halophilum TaxID=549000 RepID=A0A841PSL4_9BACL|nr:hypothetical protein [Geomicrobium halophilum]
MSRSGRRSFKHPVHTTKALPSPEGKGSMRSTGARRRRDTTVIFPGLFEHPPKALCGMGATLCRNEASFIQHFSTLFREAGPIFQCNHSLFGESNGEFSASTQEYGAYSKSSAPSGQLQTIVNLHIIYVDIYFGNPYNIFI